MKFSKGKCKNTNKPKAEVLNGEQASKTAICKKRLEESHSARINLVKVLEKKKVISYSGLQ